ncbi:MAG TPA: protein-glutamate O-methyltransferase CheR [Longimicrobiales bacterium]|nr:protein-glutamate O-methyltransferase CheR [Longimicrobiales bacterium]
MSPTLTDDEFRLFSEWIAQEYGLSFGPEKREILRARLEPRRAALNVPTFERLLFHVRFHPDREEQRQLLLSHLTNNESYFFRERSQLEVLRSEILPELGEEGVRPIRLMSAGSASGEEAFTLAIIAMETLPDRSVIVTGVDADVEAIERAKRAVYREHAFRGVDPETRSRYFHSTDGLWELDASIRRAARFRHGNIVDPAFGEGLPAQDVVFCRNVLIYFNADGVRRAVENFYRLVRPGGYLFLGHAESLSRVPTRFVAVRKPGAVFYQRPRE